MGRAWCEARNAFVVASGAAAAHNAAGGNGRVDARGAGGRGGRGGRGFAKARGELGKRHLGAAWHLPQGRQRPEQFHQEVHQEVHQQFHQEEQQKQDQDYQLIHDTMDQLMDY